MRTLILIGLVIAPPIALLLWWWWSPLAALGVMMLSHALVLYPTLRPNSQWLGPVVTSFDTSDRELWLTIDDGPTPDTPNLLDALGARGVHATFFIKGTLANANPELVRRIVERGHAIGNHSFSHPSGSFWCLPPRRIRAEIAECNRAVSAITGEMPLVFRAPVGMKNPFVHPALETTPLVGWSARAFDTATSDPETVVRRLLPDIRPGAILLLHQGRSRSVEIISRVVDEMHRLGYRFVVPDAGRLKTKR
jgi:peptidoglycan-N-acetylglucosamine deacetylase